MMNDLVSDMLTRIRNASSVRHISTLVNFSKLNLSILNILKIEGYIKECFVEKVKNKLMIRVFFIYKGWWIKKPMFSILRRVSKPGCRVFSSYKDFNKKINTLQYQQGIAIISTSVGVLSHQKAHLLKKGGEILCYIE